MAAFVRAAHHTYDAMKPAAGLELGSHTSSSPNSEYHTELADLPAEFAARGGVRYNRHMPDLRAIERQQAAEEKEDAVMSAASSESASRQGGGSTPENLDSEANAKHGLYAARGNLLKDDIESRIESLRVGKR